MTGSAALTLGTILYTRCFQTWTYRRMIATSQAFLVLLQLGDLLWVRRLNLVLDVPDAAFVFGDQVRVKK